MGKGLRGDLSSWSGAWIGKEETAVRAHVRSSCHQPDESRFGLRVVWREVKETETCLEGSHTEL